MTIENLAWYAAKREDLPEIAFGRVPFGERPANSSSAVSKGSDAKVAFLRDASGSLEYQPPSIFLLEGSSTSETLSWLRVYARNAFPLSQFARVLTEADWRMFSGGETDGQAMRTDKWASLVLGEMLAQIDFDGELEAIPVSRAAACFSTAAARAMLLHDSYSISQLCTDRLRELARDSRFGKRVVTVDALAPIWGALALTIGDVSDMPNLVTLFMGAAELANESPDIPSRQRDLFKSNPEIFSDSVEERVLAFQRISSYLYADVTRTSSAYSAAMLALAAFLVGRGTSHAFLLRKFPVLAPMAFVWFGLAAAMRGIGGWDPAWTRVVKAVERHVRATFHWGDPPVADVCWVEYQWLANTFAGNQGFSDIARATPRALSVEIVPGVACQLRMGDAAPRQSAESRSVVVSHLDQEMRVALESFILLSNKAKHLLDRGGVQPPNQPDLLAETDQNHMARPKAKRSYKRSK